MEPRPPPPREENLHVNDSCDSFVQRRKRRFADPARLNDLSSVQRRAAPLPFLRMGSTNQVQVRRMREESLAHIIEDLLELLTADLPEPASTNLVGDELYSLQSFYILRALMPILASGLEELSVSFAKPSLGEESRCSPVQFLASYLMRHNPRYSLEKRASKSSAPMEEVILQVVHSYCARQAEKARLTSREAVWESEQGERLLQVWRACCSREGDCLSLEMVRENIHVFRSSTMRLDLTPEDIFQKLDKAKSGRVPFEQFEEVLGNILVENQAALSAARKLAQPRMFAESMVGNWAREKALGKLEARLAENNVNARELFDSFTGDMRTSISMEDMKLCVSKIVNQNNLSISREDERDALAFIKGQDIIEYNDFIRVTAEIVRVSTKHVQEALRQKSHRVMQARFSSNVNRVQTYLRDLEKVEINLRRLERATRDFQETFSELLKIRKPPGKEETFSQSIAGLGNLLGNMSTQHATVRKDLNRARRLSLDPTKCSPETHEEIEGIIQTSRQRVEQSMEDKTKVESILGQISAMFGGVLPQKPPSKPHETPLPSMKSSADSMSGKSLALSASSNKKDRSITNIKPLAIPSSLDLNANSSSISPREMDLPENATNEKTTRVSENKTSDEGSAFPPTLDLSSTRAKNASTKRTKVPPVTIERGDSSTYSKRPSRSGTVQSEVNESVIRKASLETGNSSNSKVAVQHVDNAPNANTRTRPSPNDTSVLSPPTDKEPISSVSLNRSDSAAKTSRSRASSRTTRSRRSSARGSRRMSAREVYTKGQLSNATKSGNLEEMGELLASIRDEMDRATFIKTVVDEKDRNGSTPLMHAAWPGSVDMARILLENGADPMMTNLRLNTPLHFAFERGHREFAELLISHGATSALKMKNALGKTPADLNPDMFRQMNLK